ncbi:hypothetical protein HDV05_008680 [Chytridiales sp. JEL 0842]|nr:hypothetical protein HDV05_008680 [Chytridiales sp. JEL 0842]
MKATPAEEGDIPPDAAYIRVGEDGIKYQWDPEKNAWFPMWDEALIESQQAAYAFPEPSAIETSQPALPPTNPKGKNKRNFTGASSSSSEPQKKPKLEPKKKPNTSIYVTGLPPDVTFEDLKELFEKYGILMEDPATSQPRIKIYKNDDGMCKGDALVTYFKEESVELACSLADGMEALGGVLAVSPAVFKEKPKEVKAKEGGAGVEKKKVQKKIQKLEKRLDWFEEEEGKRSAKASKIVVLKHMFTKQEIDEDPTLLLDLKDEVRSECEKFGEVTNVVLYDHSDDGVITVRFSEDSSANACVARNNNRFFAGRRIVAYIWDGKEKFKETKSREEIEAEEAKRLAAFESWLEENH